MARVLNPVPVEVPMEEPALKLTLRQSKALSR